MTKRVRKAIFPVGGLGVRFLPATKAMPKEMLPVVDKPLIQYAVEEALAAGIEEFIFVTGRGKTAIEDHFDHSYELHDTLVARGKDKEIKLLESLRLQPGQVAYIRQQVPMGLGHAVWCARHLVEDEPVAVLLADDLIQAKVSCLKQMVDAHAKTGGNVIAAMDVAPDQTDKYGIVTPGKANDRLVEVKGLVEKPAPGTAPSTIAVIGRYILEPSVFQHLSRQEKGAGGEIQLTDSLSRMIGEGPFHAYRFEGTRFDCGDKAGFMEANLSFALAHETIGGKVRDMVKRVAASL